jgi:transposase
LRDRLPRLGAAVSANRPRITALKLWKRLADRTSTVGAALGATLDVVPTKKHRYTITGDEQVEFALRRGRRRFPPGTPDSRILASLVSKGDEALEREREAGADHEQRRRAAADRLAERFRRPDGFDYGALAEASGRWLRA